MKNQVQKICSMAIVGLLMFSGCLDTEEAIGKNLNPTAVVDVVSGFRVVNLNDQVQFDASQSVDSDGTICLLYTSPSPRDVSSSRMPSSA